MTIDYSNLTTRANEANKNRLAFMNKIKEGDWSCVFDSGKLGTSRSGNSMITIAAKCKSPHDPEMHDRIIRLRFVLKLDFQLDQFLNLMRDFGVDLSAIKSDDDWGSVFDDLEERRAKFQVRAKAQADNPQYNNYTVLKVQRVYGEEKVEEAPKLEAEPEAKSGAKPSKKSKTPEVTEPETSVPDESDENDDMPW